MTNCPRKNLRLLIGPYNWWPTLSSDIKLPTQLLKTFWLREKKFVKKWNRNWIKYWMDGECGWKVLKLLMLKFALENCLKICKLNLEKIRGLMLRWSKWMLTIKFLSKEWALKLKLAWKKLMLIEIRKSMNNKKILKSNKNSN